MKAEELMIGDWVCYSNANGYVTRVDDIRRYSNKALGYEYAISCVRDRRDPLYEKAPVDSFNVKILHPIPITGEILESNGFREDDNGLGYKCYICEVPCDTNDDDDYAYLRLTDFGEYWQVEVSLVGAGTTTNIPDCGVHHLQHMLRMLGIEKGIDLKERL